MIYILFVLGLFVGSFLNVVILRLEKEEGGIFTGRSKCPKCGKTLKGPELIPLISFIIQKGKCRHCQKSISYQYPLVEFFTGLLFVLLYWKFGLSWHLLFLCPLISILLILFVSDFRTQTIPDIVAYIGIALAVIYALISSSLLQFLSSSLLAATISGGFFAILVLASHETWMGQGDIKIGVLMGLILGFPKVLEALFLAFILGAVFGIILILLKKKTFKSQIAFGPFLITATFVTIMWGEEIINWYFKLLV